MMRQQIPLPHAQLPIQHVEELALDASYVLVPENACTQRPVCVLECRIIGVLGRADQGAEEDALERPFFEGYAEVDVHQRDEEGERGYFGAREDGCDQGVEFGEVGTRGPCRYGAPMAWSTVSETQSTT
jgi:hypothetical protein